MTKLTRIQLSILVGVIVLAGFLRLWQLGAADVITDEALIGFRSIGYIDFFASPYQTTPYEWFSVIPDWAKISFHDHPPLLFLIQHWFIALFGQSVFILRLPLALFGIASVYLLFLVGRKLFSTNAGLVAASLLAVSSYHVWVSRIGLQESMVIFFILLTLYLFLRSLDSSRHWQWGIALGLALLTKYTAIVVVPIIFGYILWTDRKWLKSIKFWTAWIIAAVIFSPVLFYNIKMYQASGHFDLQLSYLFGQQVPEWQFLPGKIEAGSFTDRVVSLVPNFLAGLLWPMFILFIASLLLGVYKTKLRDKNFNFVLISAVCCGLLFLIVGPSKRFVVMVVPFVILLVAWLLQQLPVRVRYGLVGVVLAIELFFTINTLLLSYPVGPVGLAYSYVKTDSYNWGYHQLNDYIEQVVRGKYPVQSLQTKYPFLQEIKAKSLAKAKRDGLQPSATLLVYDANMYDLATLWIFHRQLVYQGWPVITADDYLAQVQTDKTFWQKQGITDFYFFKIIDQDILSQSVAQQTNAAADLASQLSGTREIIKRPDGREVFAVYHWQTSN